MTIRRRAKRNNLLSSLFLRNLAFFLSITFPLAFIFFLAISSNSISRHLYQPQPFSRAQNRLLELLHFAVLFDIFWSTPPALVHIFPFAFFFPFLIFPHLFFIFLFLLSAILDSACGPGNSGHPQGLNCLSVLVLSLMHGLLHGSCCIGRFLTKSRMEKWD